MSDLIDLPWTDPPADLPPVEAEVEAWARALCKAYGVKPDKIINFPPAPRWRAYVEYARISMRAVEILKAEGRSI